MFTGRRVVSVRGRVSGARAVVGMGRVKTRRPEARDLLKTSFIISAGSVQEAEPSHRESRRLLDTRLRVHARPGYERCSLGGASCRFAVGCQERVPWLAWVGYQSPYARTASNANADAWRGVRFP